MSEDREKKKRDDFTWIILQLTTVKRKRVPLKIDASGYRRRSYSYPTNYRFKEDNEILAEQARRMRIAKLIRIGSTITMMGLVILLILVH